MWSKKKGDCSKDTESSIPLLRELTQKLSPRPGVIVFDCGKGLGCTSRGLKKDDDTAVVDLEVPAGGVFPFHFHDAVEYIIVYKGKAIITIDGVDHKLEPGESVKILHNETHQLLAITDVFAIVMLVPPDEGFPDAARD